nr:TraX family protein [Stenotrophomonas sp. NLF4-10]
MVKWIALVLMTGDHVAKVFFGGYVPVVSELGRVAFPAFALVMAYNLAQPQADVSKSVKRLALWGVIAQPAHALAFGYWLPLNVLLSFALAAACILCMQRGRWWLLALLAGPAPLFVDYQWAGLFFVLAWWWALSSPPVIRGDNSIWVVYFRGLLAVAAYGPLLLYNGNGWALVAFFLVGWLSDPLRRLPAIRRMRWAFYGYYAVHLLLLAGLLHLHPSIVYSPEPLAADASFTGL